MLYIAISIIGGVIVTVVALTLIVTTMTSNGVSPMDTINNNKSSKLSNLQRIDVRAAPITVPLPRPYFGSATGFHLFVVYVNSTGDETVCEGLPLDPATGKVPSNSVLASDPRGLLTRGYCYPYSFGIGARSPYVQSVTALTSSSSSSSSQDTSQLYDCLLKKTKAFNESNLPYYIATGPNSNSFARTLLEYCKIPAMKPAGATITPGWEIIVNLRERERESA